MAGFFRKVAGAFVELPDIPPVRTSAPAEPGPMDDDVSDLLAQLETAKSDHRQAKPAHVAAPPATPVSDVLTATPDQIYQDAGIADGPNSTHRLLKMLAGLGMFPPEQQLAMVRALDAADESWTEQGVLADARERQQALRVHNDQVEREHARRTAALNDRGKADKAQGDAMVADIDSQLAELQHLRESALGETATAMAGIDAERRALDASLENARKTTADVGAKLSELITFFAGPGRSSGADGRS